MSLIPILFERDSSRSIPRNGAGAHSRFGHKAMIGSDHRGLVYNIHRTGGLSRNRDDCMRWGCIDRR
jgi:hypothetical protein